MVSSSRNVLRTPSWEPSVSLNSFPRSLLVLQTGDSLKFIVFPVVGLESSGSGYVFTLDSTGSFTLTLTFHPLQNIIWFLPLDLIKFSMKATVIKYLRERRMRIIATEIQKGGDIPLTRTTSRAASVHESMYSNRVGFIRRAARRVTGLGNIKMSGMSLFLNIF